MSRNAGPHANIERWIQESADRRILSREQLQRIWTGVSGEMEPSAAQRSPRRFRAPHARSAILFGTAAACCLIFAGATAVTRWQQSAGAVVYRSENPVYEPLLHFKPALPADTFGARLQAVKVLQDHWNTPLYFQASYDGFQLLEAILPGRMRKPTVPGTRTLRVNGAPAYAWKFTGELGNNLTWDRQGVNYWIACDPASHFTVSQLVSIADDAVHPAGPAPVIQRQYHGWDGVMKVTGRTVILPRHGIRGYIAQKADATVVSYDGKSTVGPARFTYQRSPQTKIPQSIVINELQMKPAIAKRSLHDAGPPVTGWPPSATSYRIAQNGQMETIVSWYAPKRQLLYHAAWYYGVLQQKPSVADMLRVIDSLA